MNFLGVVEIIDRSGLVHSRVRVDHLPFRLGRALDNDLVIDDRYVCPHHAELRDDGELALIDLDSVNGSFKGLERRRAARLPLTGSVDFRLGHSLLRFRAANEVLRATAVDPLATSRLFALDQFHWALPAAMTSVVAMLIERFVASPQALKWGALISSVLPGLMVLLVWALGWSMANRMVSHRFHYLGHLSIAALGFLCASLLEPLNSYLGFAFAADALMESITNLAAAALLGTVIYGHLRLISRGSARRLLVPAGAVALTFLAMSLLPGAADSNFSSEPKLASSLKFPGAALRAGRSSEDFYAEAARALDEADEEAAEE